MNCVAQTLSSPKTAKNQDINKTASIRSPLTNRLQGRNEPLLSQSCGFLWMLWITITFTQILYSPPAMFPRVPSRGNVDVSTLGIRAPRRHCVLFRWKREQQQSACLTDGWVNFQYLAANAPSVSALRLEGASMELWPLWSRGHSLSWAVRFKMWDDSRRRDSFNMCPVHPNQITL